MIVFTIVCVCICSIALNVIQYVLREKKMNSVCSKHSSTTSIVPLVPTPYKGTYRKPTLPILDNVWMNMSTDKDTTCIVAVRREMV